MNTTNEEQARLWNGCAGSAWVDAQETLDHMFQPFEQLLVSAAASATRILDVGCGTGATTIAMAGGATIGGTPRQSAVSGASGARCTGIDISAPMIDVARRRAREQHVPAEFIVGDAQVFEFEPASFDLLVSRFGVMFFEDPAKAFANLRRAAVADAALLCQVFRSPAENPFMTAAERAAAPLLPALPPRRADGPGQFAFADARKVRDFLEAAGWRHVETRPLDRVCAMPARELDRYLMRLGPVGLALRGADEDTRARVVAAVRAAFSPYLHGDEVRFTAACWEISARA